MVGMQITSRHVYPHPPQATFEMLTDPAFLDTVCAATEPLEYTVRVEGLHSRTQRTLRNDPSIERFTGPTITVIDEITWGPATADGVRTGATLVTVAGMPVRLTGTVSLAPDGAGSTVTYDGELTVAVPLLGPSLERRAAPLLLRALEIQAEVAQTWVGSA